MNRQKLKQIGNWIYWSVTVFSLGVIVIIAKDYFRYRSLGVCPISKNNTLVYIALGLLVSSIISTTWIDYMVKKMGGKDAKEENPGGISEVLDNAESLANHEKEAQKPEADWQDDEGNGKADSE